MSLPKPKHIYVAGPMRGHKEFNFPAFVKATSRLRSEGWVVFNPAERDLNAGFDPTGMEGSDEELAELNFCLRSALGDDTQWICQNADAIYMLDGWHLSTGAIAERSLAEALGLQVIEQTTLLPNDKVRDCVVHEIIANEPTE